MIKNKWTFLTKTILALSIALLIFVWRNKPIPINEEAIAAIKNSRPLSFVQIKQAKVIQLLPDDAAAPVHQRWVIQLEDGTSLNVVYNLEIGAKIPLNRGDKVDLAGELIYRGKDAILQWTHEDPKSKRKSGYVILKGEHYGQATGP